MSSCKDALKNVIAAWESLPEGDYSSERIETWLNGEMKTAIDHARKFLGLPTKAP